MSCAGPSASPIVELGEVRVWCGRRLCNLSAAWMLTRREEGCVQVSFENALKVTVPSLQQRLGASQAVLGAVLLAHQER